MSEFPKSLCELNLKTGLLRKAYTREVDPVKRKQIRAQLIENNLLIIKARKSIELHKK